MDIIIVTGMSGAGKTQAVNALEDIGFFCVDNVPPRLLTKFAELPAQSQGNIAKVALVVDVRSKDMFAEYFGCLSDLRKANYRYKTVFLDCETRVLITRYKETRRRHPLQSDEVPSVKDAIELEREMLQAAKEQADFVIDSTRTGAALIRQRIRDLFAEESKRSMAITCTSFGFKYGLPEDADLVFDVRCLPNPYYEKELRELTGLDEPVHAFVTGLPQFVGLVPKLFDLIDYLIPLYILEGKSELVLAIGCTGGRHRSVVFVEILGRHLSEKGAAVHTIHRDIDVRTRK